MSINIEKTDKWFIIESKILFTSQDCDKNYINLFDKSWNNMNYWLSDCFKIDFPWEYDKNEIFFKVYEWDEWKLNYIIKIQDKRIALIQTPWIIEKESFESIDEWLFTNDYTTIILDKLELDWNRINLSIYWNQEVVEELTTPTETK